MLNKISCEKLVESEMIFQPGLNTIVGSNVAGNSIGKSSLLMLIDFVFGGSDFTKLCDDVIDNVGKLDIRFNFVFDNKHFSFMRSTAEPGDVYFINEKITLSLNEYKEFLEKKYGFPLYSPSFREAVNVFSRIGPKGNYNDSKPLHSFGQDSWDKIKNRLLKLYEKYEELEDLSSAQKTLKKEADNIQGAFNSGSVEKISKREFDKNRFELEKVDSEIEEIKDSLKEHVTDITNLINEKSINLKNEKDNLIENKFKFEMQLSRVENNLKGNNPIKQSAFNSVVEFFPNINSEKLKEVEAFHSGISKILRQQLIVEKSALEESLASVENSISSINSKLSTLVDSKSEPAFLLDTLLDLDKQRSTRKVQNEYREKHDNAKEEVKKSKDKVSNLTSSSLSEIEITINSGLKRHVEQLYPNKPIIPRIIFSGSNYDFNHGDDRGTGKRFANLISLDLSVLEETYLPFLIHDSIVLKNIEKNAVENLISEYQKSNKQIFIAIDEVGKYGATTRDIINKSMFVQLDEKRLAFKKAWKKRTA